MLSLGTYTYYSGDDTMAGVHVCVASDGFLTSGDEGIGDQVYLAVLPVLMAKCDIVSVWRLPP